MKQLKIFQAAAKELNLTRTARLLGYAQSSVSANIQSLEEELGFHLFERVGKRIYLTEVGKEFLGYTDKILDTLEEAENHFESKRSSIKGVLTICASETQCSYRLPDILHRFQSAYPNVQLIFKPGISEKSFQELLYEGKIDIALLSMKKMKDDLLVIKNLKREPIVIVCHPNSNLAAGRYTHEQLKHEQLLLTEPCDYRDIFEEFVNPEKRTAIKKLELADIAAIKQCVKKGLGIAALPLIAVKDEVKAGSIAILAGSQLDFQIDLQLCYHKKKIMSQALKAFIEVTEEYVGSERSLMDPSLYIS
ncbi:LysR family transcriptional regulator [Terribacillus saccharophilus]|uniref:LysR family transcriptional regulator n=1 Tax=Terribacillus saccharophilus TaxID=361277 RepID=UPI003981A406